MKRSRTNKVPNSEKQQDAFHSKIQDTTAELLDRLERLPAKHDKVNEALKAVHSQGERLLHGTKMSQSAKNKMIALYNTAQKQCESEHGTLRHLLSDIQKIRRLRFEQKISNPLPRGSLMMLLAQHASTLPLYIGSIEGHPPPLVGAIPLPANDAIGVKGDFVAAFVEDVWILAEIQNQCAGGRYEIRDIDDDLERQLLLSQNRLIALPQYRADPRRDAHALFPKDAIVLALYPQTTCFYKGVVESQPSGPDEDYQIAFEDNTFPSGYSPTLPVPQRYVLTYKDIPALHKKKSAFILDE